MSNPWEAIELRDYEGHMSAPGVGQAALLAEEFARAVETVRPKSLALLGCAGGNGLGALCGRGCERVVCVDVNGGYLDVLRRRYAALPGLECHRSEVESFRSSAPVDLVFGGLVFEFTRLDEAVESVALLLAPRGEFHALLQLPAQGLSTVSPSPYAAAMSRVIGLFRYVEPARLVEACARRGMRQTGQRVRTLAGGKSFAVLRFARQPSAEDNG